MRATTDYPNLTSSIIQERRQIATLLHDDVLQVFATCVLKAQSCTRLGEMGRHDALLPEIGQLADQLNDAVDRVRAVVATLCKDDPNVGG